MLSDMSAALTEFALKRPINPLRQYAAPLLKEAREAKKAAARLMGIASEVLQSFRERRAAATKEADRAAMDASILGMLVNNASYADDLERCSDVLAFLVAGHDTTGYTLSFALYELAKHPDVANKLAASLNSEEDAAADGARKQQQRGKKSGAAPGDSAEGDYDHDFGVSCEYLTCVIKESMRLWPVAAQGSIREPSEDVPLPNGGGDDDQGPPVIIPKGSTCLLPFLALHRTAPGVTDPEAFVPERWLAKEKPSAEEAAEAAALRDSFMPFSLGRRNCVGQAVANAELRLVIAALCRQYEFSVVNDMTPDYYLTLKPAGGLLKAVKRRGTGRERAASSDL